MATTPPDKYKTDAMAAAKSNLVAGDKTEGKSTSPECEGLNDKTFNADVHSKFASTFPMKLHCILSDPEYSEIISWMSHGRSWKVHKPAEFEKEVMSKFFNQTKYSSFTRQVNGWGFRRITSGPDRNSYYHDSFLRGRPQLCLGMKRRKKKSGFDPFGSERNASEGSIPMVTVSHPSHQFGANSNSAIDSNVPQYNFALTPHMNRGNNASFLQPYSVVGNTQMPHFNSNFPQRIDGFYQQQNYFHQQPQFLNGPIVSQNGVGIRYNNMGSNDHDNSMVLRQLEMQHRVLSSQVGNSFSNNNYNEEYNASPLSMNKL